MADFIKQHNFQDILSGCSKFRTLLNHCIVEQRGSRTQFSQGPHTLKGGGSTHTKTGLKTF